MLNGTYAHGCLHTNAPSRRHQAMFSSLRFVSELHSVGMPPVNLPAEDMSSFSSDGGISFSSGPARMRSHLRARNVDRGQRVLEPNHAPVSLL